MKDKAMVFLLGVFVAWMGLPAGIHAMYWVIILVAALSGYHFGVTR